MEKCPQVSTLKPEVILFRLSQFGSKKLEEKSEDAVLPKLEVLYHEATLNVIINYLHQKSFSDSESFG